IQLARNDIGPIDKPGSVKVTEPPAVDPYRHVMHRVSDVGGILKDGVPNMDVLQAAVPPGTLPVAPTVRAPRLTEQREPIMRGLHGGACGYLSYAGAMGVAIASRTGIVKDQVLYVQAAAGVVPAWVPEMEWREPEHKARALPRAA